LIYSDSKFGYIKDSAEYIKKQFETKGKVGPSPSPNGGVKDVGDNSAALMELGKILGAAPGQLQSLAGKSHRA
jgi:hypothetical protein